MTKVVQRRGLTTAQLATTAASARELIVDTDKKTVVVMDGVTNGGFPLVKENQFEKSIIDVDATVAANALTLTINPGTILFRSTTLTDGTPVSVVSTTPKTVVVPNGATLGTTNGVAARLPILALNVAGVIETAVGNTAGGLTLDETGLISTTAVSAAADLSTVIYSTTARTNVAYRVVGFVDITQATAGTWATAPSLVQGFGGQALAALSSLGFGQTWQDLTASRAANTTYYNTTGKPIDVSISASLAAGNSRAITVNGLTIISISSAGTHTHNMGFLVPVGGSYSINGAFTTWYELR